MTKISGFFGEYRFLSNFWDSPFEVNNIKYKSVEHFYQARKATTEADHDWVNAAETAGLAKSRGKRITLRDDWNAQHRLQTMRDGLRAKFDQNPDLKASLLATEHAELIETNSWGDNFWGVCSAGGLNMLGELLMELRDSYRMDKFYA